MIRQCELCATEERAANGYLLTLHRRPVESLVLQITESRGFCAAHTRSFLRASSSPNMPVLVYRYVVSSVLRSRDHRWRLGRAPCPACLVANQTARRAIATRPPSDFRDASCTRHATAGATSHFASIDADTQLRARLRRAGHSMDGCTACAARAAAETAALAASAGTCQPSAMCATHLADLALIDATAAERASRPVLGAECTVCRAERVADRSAAPGGTQLCLAHIERFGGRPARRHGATDLRLEVLLWELTELGRKLSWNGRAEQVGVERSAWIRAPLLLDGQVALGRGSAALAQVLGCELLARGPGRVSLGDGARLEPP